jgi:hypothetical protein
MAFVKLRRVKDGVTKLSTNSGYLADIMHECNLCKHEKTSRRGTYFLVNRDISDIPQNIFDMPNYFGNKSKEE